MTADRNDNDEKRHRPLHDPARPGRQDRLAMLTPYEYWTRAAERENRKGRAPYGGAGAKSGQ